MDNLLDENTQELAKVLRICDDDGRAVLMIGLVATFFFEEPWTRPVREAVTDVAEDYIDKFRQHLRWANYPRAANMHPIGAKRVRFPKQWLPEHEDGKSWDIGFHGGEIEGSVSDFHLSAFGCNKINDDLGFIQLYLPLLWFASHPGSLQEFALKICRRIRPISGYAGVGVLEMINSSDQNQFQPIVRQIGERFPGLEVEAPCEHTLNLKTGIKGASWLTILSDRWVEAAGGLDYLRMRLDPNFVFYPYDGGLMIQAGPKPEIGDAQANRWPKYYVELAKVLKKIQVKEHHAFHFGGPGLRLDHDASLAWLFRFDGK